MVRIEKDCVGPCPQGCIGSSCPYQHIQVWICDECGDEDVELFEYEGQELCIDCIKKMLPRVNERYGL